MYHIITCYTYITIYYSRAVTGILVATDACVHVSEGWMVRLESLVALICFNSSF